ncbi:MAG: hypothetical protein WCI51_10060 [Lentisphaerota bacterium]
MSFLRVILSLFCLGISMGMEKLYASDMRQNCHTSPSDAIKESKLSEEIFLAFDQVNLSLEKPNDAVFKIMPDGKLQVDFGIKQKSPGVTIKPKGKEVWDLSNYSELSVNVTNPGQQTAFFHLRLYGREGSRWAHIHNTSIEPGETRTLRFPLNPLGFKIDSDLKLVSMDAGCPAVIGGGINLRAIDRIVLYADPVSDKTSLIFEPLKAMHYAPALMTKVFFPFIDEYGQFIHEDWPGKVHAIVDLESDRQEEIQDLKQHPGPADRNEFGGWESGPTLRATGHFRTGKWNGKWYFVDPKGKLFWSNGLDCVTMFNSTPVQYRDHYFAEVPASGELAKYQGNINWVPLGFYKDKKLPIKSYNFGLANLHRKYGDNFTQKYFELCHSRLKSWGFNTIGNWSDFKFCEMAQTPYVRGLGLKGPRIPGSDGWWGQFPDPFHPDFRANLAEECRKNVADVANDPYCIGFFSDNELSWGKDGQLVRSVLKSPAAQAAKAQMVKYLQNKYTSIDNLNKAWGCKLAGWNALLDSRDTTPPGNHPDIDELLEFLAREFFAVCRDTIKQAAPGKLYLGSRFSHRHGAAIERAAAEYCDVVSFNSYSRGVADFDLPKNAKDTPIMIGEYNFTGLDRGVFTGSSNTQEERTDAYEKYILSALQNPRMIGAHWFQFADQPSSGRFDGENFQTGFVSITDTPYAAIIRKSREIGDKLYEIRQTQK